MYRHFDDGGDDGDDGDGGDDDDGDDDDDNDDDDVDAVFVCQHRFLHNSHVICQFLWLGPSIKRKTVGTQGRGTDCTMLPGSTVVRNLERLIGLMHPDAAVAWYRRRAFRAEPPIVSLTEEKKYTIIVLWLYEFLFDTVEKTIYLHFFLDDLYADFTPNRCPLPLVLVTHF